MEKKNIFEYSNNEHYEYFLASDECKVILETLKDDFTMYDNKYLQHFVDLLNESFNRINKSGHALSEHDIKRYRLIMDMCLDICQIDSCPSDKSFISDRSDVTVIKIDKELRLELDGLLCYYRDKFCVIFFDFKTKR